MAKKSRVPLWAAREYAHRGVRYEVWRRDHGRWFYRIGSSGEAVYGGATKGGAMEEAKAAIDARRSRSRA